MGYYGWRPQPKDHRDRIFNLEETVYQHHQVPLFYDLWKQGPTPPSIWNQLRIGSCTAHGSLRAYIIACIKAGVNVPMLSRLMQYFNTRDLEGNAGYDSGGTVRDAIKALATFGCAPEAEWPYDTSQFTVRPPSQCYADAHKHMAIKYQLVSVGGPGAPMRTAISSGMGIVFGFQVPSSFEDGSWDPASGQPLPLPDFSQGFIGGHCVCATAYDFSCKFVSGSYVNYRYPPYFTCDNSWDVTWGMQGRFNLHANWFDQYRGLAQDLWVIQQASG